MSEALFAKLPRFDLPAKRQTADIRPFDQPDPVAETPAQPDPAEADRVRAAEKLAAIEQTLTALAGKIDEVNARSKQETSEMVVSISEALFPELSRLFLAEEIGKHLPALLPDVATGVEIRAAKGLVESLNEMIGRSNRLSSLCAVIGDDAQIETQVEVTWRTGGLTFDQGVLLEACIDRLRSSQDRAGERS